MGFNEKCPWARSWTLLRLPIPRWILIARRWFNYTSNRPFPANYDSATISSWNYCVSPSPRYIYVYIYIYIVIYNGGREGGGFSFGPLSFHPPFGIFQNGHEARVGGKGRRPRESEKRRKRGREREREKKKLAEHRMEYRHSLNYFLVVRRSGHDEN